ncbi:MAG: hypothetical protein NTX45_00240 [Proteobacteria bacterium]|nr:hypothetical protein [Pseudomonadota bacterium]
MPEVNGITLAIAVQAVDAKIQSLSQEIESASEDEVTDIADLLLSYTKAADDLRDAYLVALRQSSNLPPYDELVTAGEPI